MIIQSGYNVLTYNDLQSSTGGKQSGNVLPAADADTAKYADQRKDIHEVHAPKNAEPDRDSLKRYSLPSWMSNFMPPMNDVSLSSQAVQETRTYLSQHKQFNADGVFSEADRGALELIRQGQSANHMLAYFDQQRSALSAELSEYQGYLDMAENAAQQAIGMGSDSRFYREIADDLNKNEIARKAYEDALLGSHRALELMEKLGIEIEAKAPRTEAQKRLLNAASTDTSSAEKIAYDMAVSKSTIFYDISDIIRNGPESGHLKLSTSGRIVGPSFDIFRDAFEQEAASLDEKRLALYNSEESKGTDPLKILEMMIDFTNAEASSIYREGSGQGWFHS